jgi:hypothetical protein
VKNLVVLGIVLAFFVSAPAFAVGLTHTDHDYFATQDFGPEFLTGIQIFCRRDEAGGVLFYLRP